MDPIQIILEEVRENRNEIKKLRSEVSSVKIKLASITTLVSIVLGYLGSWFRDHFK